MNNRLVCPHCKKEIEISEAFRHQIEEEVGRDLSEKHAKEIANIRQQTADELEKKLQKKYQEEQEELKEELEELKERNTKYREQELELRRQTRQLEDEKQN